MCLVLSSTFSGRKLSFVIVCRVHEAHKSWMNKLGHEFIELQLGQWENTGLLVSVIKATSFL